MSSKKMSCTAVWKTVKTVNAVGNYLGLGRAKFVPADGQKVAAGVFSNLKYGERAHIDTQGRHSFYS